MSVVEMLLQVHSLYKDSDVSQATFYQNRTIEGIVEQTSSETKHHRGLVTPLLKQRGKPKLSLICVPYAGATSTVYQPLASELEKLNLDLAVYGLSLPGNEFGSLPQPKKDWQQLAIEATREIAENIEGKVAIYGHCVGSYLALELTRQLELIGKNVEFLMVGAAFPLPRIIRYLPFDDRWKYKSDDSMWELLSQWGLPNGNVSDEVRSFMISNFRRDAKHAYGYEKYRDNWKVRAPVFNIVSKQDPLTDNYERRFLKWKGAATSIHLLVLEEGRHYFVGEKPDLVANIIRYIDQQKASFTGTNESITTWYRQP